MAYGSPGEAGYGAGAFVVHHDGASVDALHPDSFHGSFVQVPDVELLFTGDFRRAGPDLVLTGRDGRHHLIPDYFAGEKRPALGSPNGASLRPDLVDMLAGSPAPGQYAQAQAIDPSAAIGKVEKVVGTATAMRNGVPVTLNIGDPVYKSDVIQTGADSSCGISFPDGTALNLVANTRMALNDYSYDAGGTSNSALFSLVEGTFAFVAGKVAHTGDMKIETPAATMGIRGTTGYVEQVATVTATLGNVTYSFAVVEDYGTNNHGRYDLIDANGNVIATVAQTGILTFVTPQGPGLAPVVTTAPLTNSQYGFEQQIIQQVFQVLNSSTNPQSTPSAPGSSTPPPPPLGPLQQLIRENGGSQFSINVQNGGSGGSGSADVDQGVIPSTVIWTSSNSGTWPTPISWNDGSAPLAVQIVKIPDPDPTNPVTVTLVDSAAASGLVLGAGAVSNIAGGTFTISNTIDNAGQIEINGAGGDPTLAISGTVLVLGGGEIELQPPVPANPAANNIVGVPNTHATLTNVDNTIIGSGTIGTGDGSLTLVNGVDGTIEAAGGTLILNTGNAIDNSGILEAGPGGTLQIIDVVDNAGLIEAATPDATLDVQTAQIIWTGGTAAPGINGILLYGTLLVDVADLQLSGGGAVLLVGGAIGGVASANILENVDNTISGYGTIGGGAGAVTRA